MSQIIETFLKCLEWRMNFSTEAIFSMEHNKAPGSDGFLAEFYQHFWEIVKTDLMHMFHDLSRGDLALFRLNFGTITLIPKV